MIKMRSILMIVSILISAFVYAQDAPNKTDAAGKKQGHWIKFDDGHKKIYDGNFENGVPVGKFTYYYDTGIPWSISIFSQNGKVARSQMFDAGGKLIGEGKYVSEKKDSVWKFYNQEGKLLSDEPYLNGIKNGNCRIYYANGTVSEEKMWKNGKMDGLCKKYFETGQIKYSGAYVQDKVEGKVIYYYKSGKIDAEGMYVNDLKDGPWNYYNEDGTVKRTDTFVTGNMVSSTDKNKDIITKEQQAEEKKNSQQFEIKDPYQEGYHPEQ